MLTVFGQSYSAATESPRDVRLSAGSVAADLALAREALETIHAGFDRYTNRAVLDAQWASLEAEATDAMTHGELYLGISRVLATIRCNHTKAELPDDMKAARKSEPTYLPFRYRFFHGRMFVTQAADGVDLAAQDEVLTIDGRTVIDLISDVSAVVPVDGDTDYVKEHLIGSFGEFMGPAFEHFMPFLYAISANAELTVRRASGASTGATAGVIAFLTLPESGIRVRIPSQRTIMANADKLDSRSGIRPDIEALQTLASAFKGEDPALAAAKAVFGL